MDTEVRELVTRRLESSLKIEVMRFFLNAFSPLSTAAGISLWLGVSTEQLGSLLEALCREGLLTRHGDGEAAVFGLAAAAEISEPLARLMELYEDEERRAEVMAALRG